jgi:hypothetical protein
MKIPSLDLGVTIKICSSCTTGFLYSLPRGSNTLSLHTRKHTRRLYIVFHEFPFSLETWLFSTCGTTFARSWCCASSVEVGKYLGQIVSSRLMVKFQGHDSEVDSCIHTVHESLACWRAPRNVNINRYNTIASSNNTVRVVVVTTAVRAAAHADNPPRVGHLIVNLA